MFPTFDISGSGLALSSFWLDTVAHNIANVNTLTRGDEEPFRAASPVATPKEGGGVRVAGLFAVEGEPARFFDPSHPLADEDGIVTRPVVDLGVQMVDMIVAGRSYQANLRTVEAAKEMYQAALRIGR